MSRLTTIARRPRRDRGPIAAPHAAGAPDEMRLAAIDVGSNSIHMVIAQVDAAGGISELSRSREMVGLGRMSFPSHRLSGQAMERAMITLRRFVSEANRWQCERTLAIATSAVRESENGGEFLERVRRELGVHVRVVSARDEARLIYLGVRQATDLDGGPHLILDIGGGSVEFIVAAGADKPLLLESRKLGAARMTARYIKSDPVEARELKALLSHYDAELTPVLDEVRRHRPVRMLGTSGAVENLAAVCSGNTGGGSASASAMLRRTDLQKLVDQLIESRAEDRARIKGLDDKRRDQILAAAILVLEVFRRLDIDRLEVCRSALREGILVDYLARHRPELEVRREVPNPRRREIVDLGRRCHWQREHGEQVARLCVRLFDQLRPLHGLGRTDRELIEYAALLHDVGRLIGREKHHKHSAYLIRNGDLEHFRKGEIEVIALIARYHRKSSPHKNHRRFRKLPKHWRRVVEVGAPLLRIADGLDRTNCSIVTDVTCRTRTDEIELLIDSRGDAELEVWSARSRSKLFERVIRRDVLVRSLS
jgi:exopolyphosphatase/guanosine-5'-triphosphate,3'-diphosphate pyrophosphatase